MNYAPLPETNPHGFIPALDGLRAISILLVMVGHAGFGNIVPGGLGVTVFFGISGFIITWLLLNEYEDRGRIAPGIFYLRRVVRLYPALVIYVALASAVMLLLGAPLRLGELAAALFYGANYWTLWIGFHDSPALAPHPFAILWSLAIEEHFYLFFPVLLGLLLRRGAFLPVMAAGMIVVMAWRLFVYTTCADGQSYGLCGDFASYRIYKATDTRLDAILYGCALAPLCRAGAVPRWLAHPATLVLALLALIASLLWRDPAFRDTWRYGLQSLAIAVAMGSLLCTPSLGWLRRVLSLPPLLLIGRMSYVFYLFHWLAVVLACRWAGVPLRDAPYPPVWYAYAIPLTLLPCLLVHFGVELPLAGLRRRLRR